MKKFTLSLSVLSLIVFSSLSYADFKLYETGKIDGDILGGACGIQLYSSSSGKVSDVDVEIGRETWSLAEPQNIGKLTVSSGGRYQTSDAKVSLFVGSCDTSSILHFEIGEGAKLKAFTFTNGCPGFGVKPESFRCLVE